MFRCTAQYRKVLISVENIASQLTIEVLRQRTRIGQSSGPIFVDDLPTVRFIFAKSVDLRYGAKIVMDDDGNATPPY